MSLKFAVIITTMVKLKDKSLDNDDIIEIEVLFILLNFDLYFNYNLKVNFVSIVTKIFLISIDIFQSLMLLKYLIANIDVVTYFTHVNAKSFTLNVAPHISI